MKNLLTLILLFGLSVHLIAQTEQRLTADIQHVTVFLDKAQIDAVAKTSVVMGTSKIVIENLANTIDPNSIQVSGKGNLVIMGVKFQQNYLKKRATIALEDSLKQTNNDIENLEMLITVADNERIMLMANANIKTEKTGITPTDLKEMSIFFRTKLTEIGTRKLQVQNQINELKNKKTRLEQHLNEQNNNANAPSGEIIITVSAKQFTPAEISLSYVVNNAGWSPVYDLRATNTKSPISMIYRANVYQNTGTDWKNVRLTLSTSNPSLGGNKPTLGSQMISIYEPRPIYSMQMRAKGVETSMATADAAPAPLAEMATTADYTTVKESAISVNFDIDLPYSIHSGGSAELVEIQNINLPAEYSYFVTPKLDKDGFLVAKISDWEKYNLLAGSANVYFEGTFVGETQISPSTTDSLQISLGRDKKVITKREIIEDFNNRKNSSSSIKQSVGYRISLKNTKSEAIIVTVEDQFPVSKDNRIEIELLEASGGEVNKETGIITWKVALAPNANKDLILKYTVKYPKGKIIMNL